MYKLRRACAVALCLCALLSLCACGSKSGENAAAPAQTETSVQTQVTAVNSVQNESPAVTSVPVSPAEEISPAQNVPAPSPVFDTAELNEFLSFFARQGFEGFSDFDADFARLADFVHLYARIHEPALLSSRTLPNGKDYDSIALEEANCVLERFFGRSAGEELASGYVKTAYDGDIVYGMFYEGCFCFEKDGLKFYRRLAIADSVSPAAGGSYAVNFTVYSFEGPENFPAPNLYSLTAEEAAAESSIRPHESGSAIVIYENGSFILSSYSLN